MPFAADHEQREQEDAEERADARARPRSTRRWPSISPFIRRPVRHMWTVREATETAATSASGPSSHSWLAAL